MANSCPTVRECCLFPPSSNLNCAPKVGPDGGRPPPAQMSEMMGYQQKIAESGKLVWAERLYPTTKEAVRVLTDASGNVSVQEGPFDGPSLGGYGILNVASIDEAVDIVKGFPHHQPGSGLEIRRIINISELPLPEEILSKQKALRDLMKKNAAAAHS